MKFVSEKIIDGVIDQLDGLAEQAYESRMQQFADRQPVAFAYLFSEQFDLLTDDEKGYLQYLALIIHESWLKVNPDTDPISEEELGLAEERNHEILEASGGATLKKRLDPFFENTPQEDLLAMVEDAVLDEEDLEVLTKEGREPIFIALKSLIDCLQGEESEG